MSENPHDQLAQEAEVNGFGQEQHLLPWADHLLPLSDAYWLQDAFLPDGFQAFLQK